MNQRIITSAKECAYRAEIGSLIYCKHPMARAIEYCNVSKFPDVCPLDEPLEMPYTMDVGKFYKLENEYS
jgi:hypothetical protein